MELDLGLLADNAHVDQGGKLYILGEFRYIVTPTVPAVHGQMFMVLRFTAPTVEVREGRAMLRLEFVDEDGHSVVPNNPPESPINFGPIGPAERATSMAQVVVGMGNLPLPKYGGYTIHTWVNGKRVGEVKFHVMEPPTPPALPAAG